MPISLEQRLTVCLYCLGSGNYIHVITQVTGLVSSTVSDIVIEVCEAILEALWTDHVDKHFPKNADDYEESLIVFYSFRQFPFCFGAADGYHIPIKCLTGGLEANKE